MRHRPNDATHAWVTLLATATCWVVLALYGLPAVAQGAPHKAPPGCAQVTRGDRFANGEDYRRPTPHLLGMVERAHFPASVETLVKTKKGTFGGDLDYTLFAYPNHPRALLTLIRLGEREKKDPPVGASYTIDCFFRRALMFFPDDAVVRVIYATYLAKQQRREDAIAQLETAAVATKDNPLMQYNVGLVYMDLKEFDRALRMAHRVIALDAPPGALKQQLEAAGRWVEPAPGLADSPSSAAPTTLGTSSAASGAGRP
jgi:hypothetical protein